ncbi:hypothetical protein KY289_026800 [Solanum tuberosum]|nr:hypothetical protein KY289_026800 [Solanum tuberosum]
MDNYCKDLTLKNLIREFPYVQEPDVSLTERGLVAFSAGSTRFYSFAAMVVIARNCSKLIQFRFCLLKPTTSDYLTPEKLNAGYEAIIHHCKGLRPLLLSSVLMDHVFHYIWPMLKS